MDQTPDITSSEANPVALVGTRRMRRFAMWCAASIALLVALPVDAKAPWYLVFCIVTLTIAFRRGRTFPREIRRVVLVLATAGVVSVLGGVARAVHGMLVGELSPFPSVADIFIFASYGLFLAAILMVVRRRSPRLGLDPVLDALVGGVAAALVQWTLVVIPYLETAGIPSNERAVNVLYSCASLLMILAAVLALVAGSRPSTSNRLLAGGLVAAFVMDVVAVRVTAGELSDVTLLYCSAAVLTLGVGGMIHPSVLQLLERPTDLAMSRRLSRRRITVLALALLTPPVLLSLIVYGGHGGVRLLLPAVGGLALTPLVVLRLGRLVRQNEELASLEATLRGVGERLVSAETTDDVVRIITAGAEQVLGPIYLEGGLITTAAREDGVSPSLLPAVDAAMTHVADVDRPVTGELFSPPSGDAAERWIAGPIVVQRELHGMLVLVTRRPLRDEEINAVTALCRESAIAFRAVEHTEQQVRQRSEDRFAALVDNSSDIVAVLDADRRLTYVSPVVGRLLGYTPEQFLQLDMMTLVHDDDRTAALKMLDDIRFGMRETSVIRLRHSAGTHHWFEMVGVDLSSDPNIGGIVLNAREITDRKQAEERLAFSEAWFKALVQNSTDLVVVLDPDGRVSYASPSVTAALGQGPEVLRGMQVTEVFRESDVDWTAKWAREPEGGPGITELLEFTFQNVDEQWRTIDTTITDLRSEPAVGGFVLNARDVTDRRAMEQRLRYQATHDELTGLANRVHVLDDLTGMLGRNSGSTTVAAILIGIDDFKDINDSLGHAAGDELLISVAARVTGMLGFGDVAARVGGDEFAVVLERGHGENHVTDLAEQILTAIASPHLVEGRELTVTASAGIVFDHDRSATGEILLRNADIAMYRAKTLGKRQVVVFEPHMHTDSYDRLELRADLARAIEGEQFVAHYQPVIDIVSRRVVGAEALIRWQHPERGMLPPNLFIPLAEESGMIGALGEWILERACRDLVAWRQEFGGPVMDFTMSVNLSVQQLHEDRIVGKVHEILTRTGLPAERLVLEVTESTLITDTDRISETMSALRNLGARFAIDDFGTGYSSLGYIQQFEFDVLKIDKSFVDSLESNTNQRIVTAVLELARQLGVRTIAEGIETEIQAALLEELGCTYGQGYLFSRPVPEASLREILASSRETVSGRVTL